MNKSIILLKKHKTRLNGEKQTRYFKAGKTGLFQQISWNKCKHSREKKKSLILVILHTIHQKSPAEINFKMLLGTQYLQHMAKEPQTRKRGKLQQKHY